ncbi:MAG: septum formation initiator family protein [Bdellovibrionaceae bacterium]|nr:septum formation initiator family protein [Pseudobdellovibrionaceae bacterium]
MFIACVVFATLSLGFDGILWRLWGLRQDRERMTNDMVHLRTEVVSLDRQLRQAKDPSFIERQARDRLDLAGENDLVFVFPEE